MSFWDFVKSAGRLLGPGHAEAATQDESKPAPPPPSADAIKQEFQRLGLNASQIQVDVEGDTVHLKGNAPDAETHEKLVLAAGNVAGIAKVGDDLATAAGGSGQSKFHTVVKGDTLSAIAQKHLGNASKYQAIFEANRPMLSDPNKIYPGQVLRIPPQA